MNNYEQRLAALTPEQRKLLEQRLKQKTVNPEHSVRQTDAVAEESAQPSVSAHTITNASIETQQKPESNLKPLQFSLIFFSDDGSQKAAGKYDMLLNATRYVDQHGFTAVWIPERHMHPFGGLYPSPSVLAAALAMVTEHIQIRAGSVVLPLHHPLRVTEDWSVVDNLSGGRIGLAFASGWVINDFILGYKPFQQRRETLFEDLAHFKKLWQGEKVQFTTPEAVTVEAQAYPAPLQQHVPIWITSSSSIDTWVRAGEIGANILTALLQQSIEEVEERIAVYRAARARNGFDPETGIVTLMLHTFIWDDAEQVYQKVRKPLMAYMQTHMDIYKQMSQTAGIKHAIEDLNEEDRLALADFAFQKYFHHNGLFGTPQSCQTMLKRLQTIGVNEIASLMDFGIDAQTLLESLQYLDQLREQYQDVTYKAYHPVD